MVEAKHTLCSACAAQAGSMGLCGLEDGGAERLRAKFEQIQGVGYHCIQRCGF